ncbi:MAG: hypothetical protein R2715_16700 [Ilumatobacteraceae bacterium]
MSILRPRSHGLAVARHRATTANLCSLYPWHTGPGPSTAGPYLGVNWSAGGSGWFYDPFELYGALLTDSNMLIAGRPGKGKSAAVKAFLHREIAVYGRRRFIAINDPKGEYGPLGEALGIPVIKLHPGGQHRLNPLDPAPGDQTGGLLGRQKLVTGMLAIVADKRLEPAEEALIPERSSTSPDDDSCSTSTTSPTSSQNSPPSYSLTPNSSGSPNSSCEPQRTR